MFGKLFYPLALISSLALPRAGLANVFDAHDDCLQALERDANEAKMAAGLVLTMVPISSSGLQRSGIACLSGAFGGVWEYDENVGLFAPSGVIDFAAIVPFVPQESREELSDRLEQFELRRLRLLRQELAPLMSRLEAANRDIVASQVFKACVQVFQRDTTSAMTNPVCVDAFLAQGHPKLFETTDFEGLLSKLESVASIEDGAEAMKLARELLR